MPSTSDVYMELSDPAVWGETYDEQFGMGAKGRQLGAVEISSFNFTIDETPPKQTPGATSARGATQPGSNATADATASTKKRFSISKYIDKGSPDLFLACCMKSPIAWCIISVRESGESNRVPYLVVEFQRLHVESFKWEDLPGDTESASKLETVEFSYETVLIKYSRQDRSGEHPVVKIKGYDFSDHPSPVTELDTRLGGSMVED